MKKILEFEMPGEMYAYSVASKGADLAAVVFEFDEFLRQKVKYGDLDEAEEGVYRAVRSELWRMIDDRGLRNL